MYSLLEIIGAPDIERRIRAFEDIDKMSTDLTLFLLHHGDPTASEVFPVLKHTHIRRTTNMIV